MIHVEESPEQLSQEAPGGQLLAPGAITSRWAVTSDVPFWHSMELKQNQDFSEWSFLYAKMTAQEPSLARFCQKGTLSVLLECTQQTVVQVEDKDWFF